MTITNNKEISKFADVEGVLISCIMAIACPKGKFYPDKNYGNSVRQSLDCGELLAAARQAVRDIDGVYIKTMRMNNDKTELEIIINDEARRVEINFEQNI